MYSIEMFDDSTMGYVVIYSSDNGNLIVPMYNYFTKKYTGFLFRCVVEIQSNEAMLC